MGTIGGFDGVADTHPHKVILLGNAGVGKTSLFRIFAGRGVDGPKSMLPGQTMRLYDDLGIQMWLWDTAGTERYNSLTHSYYKDATAAIFVFDQTKPDTLTEVSSKWVEAYENHATCYTQKTKPHLFLVATNLDKVKKLSECETFGESVEYVRQKAVEKFQHELEGRQVHFSRTYHVSKNNADGVLKMFEDIACVLKNEDTPEKKPVVKITSDERKEKWHKCVRCN